MSARVPQTPAQLRQSRPARPPALRIHACSGQAGRRRMSQQYIQLRPLGALGPSGEDDAEDNYFMYDDDDNYQYEVNPCTALSCCHVSFAV